MSKASTVASKSPASPTGRTYGPRAQKEVAKALHEEKQGDLHSGRSGKVVTDPKQAIAIGLSRARKAGAKVPPPPGKT